MKFSTTLLGLAAYSPLASGLALLTAVTDTVNSLTDTVNSLVVPDTYIVMFKAGADPIQCLNHITTINNKAISSSYKGVQNVFNISGMAGYAVNMLLADLNSLVVPSDLVNYVDKDLYTSTSAVVAPVDARSNRPTKAFEARALSTQTSSTWGLGRISHKATGSGGTYVADSTGGAGVRVYVVDTGILTTHTEFGGRAVWGKNFINGSADTDEYGHGTHVSGTIGGKTYGVAKSSTLVAVKVMDKNGSGTMSIMIAGINWAVSDAQALGVANKSVINLSMGGSFIQSANDAVNAATQAGMTVVVAAGNNGLDASKYSPGSSTNVITVGATNATDYRAAFSNFGSLVNIHAPGVNILSSYNTGTSATVYMSGTSMAAPHVAGLAAYYIAKEGLTGYSAVSNRILQSAVAGTVQNVTGSANLVAYNGSGL